MSVHASSERVRLSAESILPLIGDSRHEVITATGTYQYVRNGIEFTASDGETRYFSYDRWLIHLERIGDAGASSIPTGEVGQ